MRLFWTYVLLAALTTQSFYRNIMVMDYQINLPDYIAKCINKDKPELHCDGQCVLMKKIKEQEKRETQKNYVVYDYSALYVHKEYLVLETQLPSGESGQNQFLAYLDNYTYEYHSPIFHPPLA
ncbi:hypothetical protein [Albibacterium profundi]|uniref:Uncharacterized protein n=1 Tax=Albibacterium profundi TaxID=3134906 RepID=A0ABV5C9H2_9SPHI